MSRIDRTTLIPVPAFPLANLVRVRAALLSQAHRSRRNAERAYEKGLDILVDKQVGSAVILEQAARDIVSAIKAAVPQDVFEVLVRCNFDLRELE